MSEQQQQALARLSPEAMRVYLQAQANRHGRVEAARQARQAGIPLAVVHLHLLGRFPHPFRMASGTMFNTLGA